MSYILRFIEEGEHQRQDFKMRIDSSRKISKTISAFANTQGGRILIGVKDSGTIHGVNIEEELHMIEAASQMYCQPPIEYTSQIWHWDNKKILEIIIEPSEERPHLAEVELNDWQCFTRVDDKIKKANGVLQKVWTNEKQDIKSHFEYDREKEKLFNYIRRRGFITFKTVSKITQLSFADTEDLLSNLVIWEVLEMNLGKDKCTYSIKLDENN